MKKNVLTLAAIILLITGCKKKDNSTPDVSNNTTTGSSTTTGFTPPTTNYYIVSDSIHTPDMSVASCNLNGGSFGISKPFNKLNINPAQLRIFFDSLGSSSYRNIRNSLSEGSYRIFDIDTVPTTLTNHVNVELDASELGGQFFYKAIGKLYVSKTNNKLRFTSDGILNMTGKKYLGPGFSSSIYSRTVKFSIEEGAQF